MPALGQYILKSSLISLQCRFCKPSVDLLHIDLYLDYIVISDNASTYMSASKELNKLFQSPILKRRVQHGTHLEESPMVWGLLGMVDWYGEDVFIEGPWSSLHYSNSIVDYCC